MLGIIFTRQFLSKILEIHQKEGVDHVSRVQTTDRNYSGGTIKEICFRKSHQGIPSSYKQIRRIPVEKPSGVLRTGFSALAFCNGE
jgi:hypothetical protein